MLDPKFNHLIEFLKDKKVLITTHDLVDIDGLASCFSLKLFLNEIFNESNSSIYLSEISKSTKSFMKKFEEKFHDFDFKYERKLKLSEFDVCIILDANKINQLSSNILDEFLQLDLINIYIDHHYIGKKNNQDSLSLIYENYSSTSEILLEIFKNYNIQIPNHFRYLIIAAILTDTGYFKYANNNTIKNVYYLLKNDINIQDLLLLLENDIDISEKIAKIKGLQRVRLIREGDYLIGLTNVSSYGASVASTLIKIGFDIGIVYSIEKSELMVNTRAKKQICLKTNLHLGKILEDISINYSGSGGGHDGAASLTCRAEKKEVIDEIVINIKKILKGK
jgi:phosphoesterase RecJ-like protein